LVARLEFVVAALDFLLLA